MQSKSRSGAPFDPRVVNNLQTSVGSWSDIARVDDKRKRLKFQRMRKKNNWTSNSLEVNFSTALNQLATISSFLKIPNYVEKEAAVIYRQAAEKGLTVKRSIESIVVGSLYVATRVHSIPKSMEEFVSASKITKKVLGKTYKLIVRELKIKLIPSDPVEFVPRFASALGLSAKVQTRAVEYIVTAKEKEMLSGLSPISVAATTLYLAGLVEGERKTQKDVADTTGITEATLRSRCKDFMRDLKIDVKIR
jgi:transcription initiation factor TFIIB